MNALETLEAEAIHILRETAAQFERPVLLYSIGKDSSVMVHLARKAFYPGQIPFPLMHIDTGYEYPEMIPPGAAARRFISQGRPRVVRERNLDRHFA